MTTPTSEEACSVPRAITPSLMYRNAPSGRSGMVRDPFGHHWHISSRLRSPAP